MDRTYRQIELECRGDVFCVRLRAPRLEETAVYELADELVALADAGCHKLALSLGPGSPECLYSVFLSKLVTVQRQLGEHGVSMVLCDVSPEVRSVFEACRLDQQFRFVPDFAAAVTSWPA
jgi:anti-anti-sigma factor